MSIPLSLLQLTVHFSDSLNCTNIEPFICPGIGRHINLTFTIGSQPANIIYVDYNPPTISVINLVNYFP